MYTYVYVYIYIYTYVFHCFFICIYPYPYIYMYVFIHRARQPCSGIHCHESRVVEIARGLSFLLNILVCICRLYIYFIELLAHLRRARQPRCGHKDKYMSICIYVYIDISIYILMHVCILLFKYYLYMYMDFHIYIYVCVHTQGLPTALLAPLP